MVTLLLVLLILDPEDTFRPAGPPTNADALDCYAAPLGGPWRLVETIPPDGACRALAVLEFPPGTVVQFAVAARNAVGSSTLRELEHDQGGGYVRTSVVWPAVCAFTTRAELLACLGTP